MEDMLINIGLTGPQAQTYLWLLEHGSTTPPRLVRELKLTRTNAYKVLDSLVDLGLASKAEVRKKLTYFPEDPIALSTLAAEERNRVIALEQNTKEAVFDLRRKFKKASGGTVIKTHTGKVAVKAAYERQASLRQPMYFIKSRADIPVMGFETMDYIRRLAKSFDFIRHGITQDVAEGPVNPVIDKNSNLERTWMPAEDYTAPVEWCVAGNELNIVVFDKDPRVIQIKNSEIAEAFLQIWKMLDKNLKASPDYDKMPRRAKRAV